VTVIEVYRRGGIPTGLRVYGHSGCAESGSDVVCAAVSVLVQTLHIGLADILGQNPKCKIEEEKALIELHWDNAEVESVRVLSETIARALYETAQSYGSYVKYLEVSL